MRGVKEGEPLSEALISPGVPVRFVLELKKGTAERTGIEDGDLIRHPDQRRDQPDQPGLTAKARAPPKRIDDACSISPMTASISLSSTGGRRRAR